MSSKQVSDKKNKHFSHKTSYKKDISILQEFNWSFERLNFSNVTHEHQHKTIYVPENDESQGFFISTGWYAILALSIFRKFVKIF